MDSLTVTPRWVEQWTGEAWRLQVGRVTLAILVSRRGEWYVGSDFSGLEGALNRALPDEQTARALAEAHARRVLGDA